MLQYPNKHQFCDACSTINWTVLLNYHMCDAIQGNQSEVKYVTVLYLLELLIIRGTFCWKHHLNRTSGFKVSNWRILKTRENKRNPFFFLFSGPRSNNKCSRLPTDYARSQHIIWDNYKSEFLMHKMKSISCWKMHFEKRFLNINVETLISQRHNRDFYVHFLFHTGAWCLYKQLRCTVDRS